MRLESKGTSEPGSNFCIQLPVGLFLPETLLMGRKTWLRSLGTRGHPKLSLSTLCLTFIVRDSPGLDLLAELYHTLGLTFPVYPRILCQASIA